MRLRRILRWPLYLVIAIATIGLLGALWLQTGWGHNTLRQMAINRSAAWIDGELSIGGMSGSIFRTVTFTDVVIKQHGAPVLTVASMRANYSISQMISSRSVALDQLTLD